MTELATTAVEVRSDGGTTATMSGDATAMMEPGDDDMTTATSNSEKQEVTTAVGAKRQQTTTEWSEATQRCERRKRRTWLFFY
jgi:hypothetical protein